MNQIMMLKTQGDAITYAARPRDTWSVEIDVWMLEPGS